jgi:hypothetical protein
MAIAKCLALAVNSVLKAIFSRELRKGHASTGLLMGSV